MNGDFKNYISYHEIARSQLNTSLVYYIKANPGYKEIHCINDKWKYQDFFGWWHEISENETVYKLVELSAADYQASLVSAGNSSGTVNSVVSQTINNLAASGATYTEYGMLMAGEVFKNNPIASDQTRKRVVVLFTDGSTNSDRNTVLGHSNTLKKTYRADVFTVGLGVEGESDFLRYISSDYKDDTSYKNNKYSGTASADGIDYSLNAKTAEGLKEAFEKIAQDVASVPADATTVLSDTMSDMFVPTTDAKGVKVYTQTASGTESKPSWGDPVDITSKVSVNLDGKTVKVSGFNYNENLVLQKNGTWQGKKLVVKFGIKPDTTYTNWQKGTHYYDTNNITDKQAALHDKDGKVLGESLDKSPQLPVTGHSITYSWSGAPTGENVPVDNNVYVKGQSYTVDSKYTKDTQVPTWDDYDNVNGIYTFSGWNDPNNGVMGDSDITITGRWTYEGQQVANHKITYDWGTENIPERADVILPINSNTYVKGQPYEVDKTFTAGKTIDVTDQYGNVIGTYTFSGWNDPNNGEMGDSDITITGHWTYEKIDPETVTLDYDANGGEGKMTDEASPYVKNSEAKVLDNEFTRSNYRFTGWNTEADGSGVSYKAGDVIKMTANMTLYAQWKHKGGGGSGDKKVTLHYESNGGTTYKDERYTYGTTVKLDKTPLREGHTFTGWYADKELTKKISNITMKGDKTVYAGWELTPVPPAFDGDHTAYIIGFVDGTVKPLANITRSEVAAIFYRLLSDEEREKYKTTNNNFADVDPSAWYNTPASTMAAMGIIGGYPDGLFHGTDNITRAEFAAICARFDKNTENTKADFSDISGHWAELDIAIAANNGWIMGYPDGTFRPNQTITRAEAMALINRVLARIPESPQDLLDGMKTWPDNMNTDKWYYIPVQEATNSHDFERKANGSEKWTALNKDAGVMP